MNNLPKDVCCYLTQFLDLKSLNLLLQTNQEWYNRLKNYTRLITSKLEVYTLNIRNQKTGWYTSYHFAGQPWQKVYFENDKMEGLYQEWYPTGEIKEISYYKNDQRNGDFTTWYVNGAKETEAYYIQGVLDGRYKGYYDNNQLSFIRKYRMGVAYGKYKMWRKNGALWTFDYKELTT